MRAVARRAARAKRDQRKGQPPWAELAARLAALTGEATDAAIAQALRERIARLELEGGSRDDLDAALAIACRCMALPDRDDRPVGEILDYDDRGLW